MVFKFWTIALILVGLTIIGAIAQLVAQPTTPTELPGCVYNSTPPTLTNRQITTFQCDVNGKLITG